MHPLIEIVNTMFFGKSILEIQNIYKNKKTQKIYKNIS